MVDPTADEIAAAQSAGSAANDATGESQTFSAVSAAAVSEAASSSAVASSSATDTVDFWTPGSNVDTNTNTGTYGDSGLEDYIYTDDPFASTVDGTVDTVAKTLVLAKGMYGTVKWYISEDGILHLGAGASITWTSSLPSGTSSPWATISK